MPPSGKNDPSDTPAMRQYKAFKERYPDCVLFFRMGDFYEMFHDDALLAHRVLGVTLTKRTEGVPMAGVPYHAVEGYLRRMIQAGHRVAVCDQVEDPAQAKGIVQRDITRVVTPGTITDDALLDESKDNLLAAVMFLAEGPAPSKPADALSSNQKSEISNQKPALHVALAWVELSTGLFQVASLTQDQISEEIARLSPREILYVETANRQPPERVARLTTIANCSATARPAWQFRQNEAVESLTKQFGVASLSGFGFEHDDPVLGPAGAIVHYLIETQRAGGESANIGPSTAYATSGLKRTLAHLQPPRRFNRSDYLVIDATSLRSLEVDRTLRTGQTEGSLLGVMQDCRTSMGKRLLRQWLCFPLCSRPAIEARQRGVGAMVEDAKFLDDLRSILDGVQDVERIIGRIAVGRALPRDLVALGESARQAGKLLDLIADRPAVAGHHDRLAKVTDELNKLGKTIACACVDSPPGHLREGGLFKDGHDAQLDELRLLQRDSSVWLAGYQKSLIERTGITSLKVGFNRVFGFYIELTALNAGKAPAEWSRKQTLKNAERYITPELKGYEDKVLSAQQKAIAREQELFAGLCEEAQTHLEDLRTLSAVTAELDVLACFARRAARRRYVRPMLVDEPVLRVKGGRHPVLDEILGDRFVPNDVDLGSDGISDFGLQFSDLKQGEERFADATSTNPKSEIRNPKSPCSLALITGPNMAGKSTFIRQAALITLLAHTGSFVPAEAAVVGLCDRVFTRIGASDELHSGQSTFMIEMTETANICHHATPHSLVILDEIGRGTSTLDGLSLAWAIAEHLARRGSRTLFATHYHELTALGEAFANVANLHVTVREWADQIVFLHRVVAGATDKSYGIHVAKIAGLPAPVVSRARELLDQLEVNHTPHATQIEAQKRQHSTSTPQAGQLSLFKEYIEHPAVDHLRAVDLNELTPMQAFDLLRKIKQEITNPPT